MTQNRHRKKRRKKEKKKSKQAVPRIYISPYPGLGFVGEDIKKPVGERVPEAGGARAGEKYHELDELASVRRQNPFLEHQQQGLGRHEHGMGALFFMWVTVRCVHGKSTACWVYSLCVVYGMVCT